MNASENPTEFLKEVRRLANKITSAYDKHKKIDANDCVNLAKKFEDLDQHLTEGGDAPEPWSDKDDNDIDLGP